MIVGPKVPGVQTSDLAADQVRVSTLAMPNEEHLVALTARLDGLGPSNAPQSVRAVVYSAAGVLLAASDELVIADNSEAAWYLFQFPDAGLLLPDANVQIGLLGGPTGASARVYRDATANGHRTAADSYIDGPAAALGGTANQVGVLSMFLTVLDSWAPDAGVTEGDETYARMPFEVAQRIIGETAPMRGTRVRARAGFHGTNTDPEEPAFAIVRTGGPLEHLVGERIRVSRRVGPAVHEVFALVHDEQDWPDGMDDEDLSLTRRGWLELCGWPREPIRVYVETLD